MMVRKGTALKGEIIATAHAFFSEKGYDDTTVNDIIQRLGISKGGFYHYFKSKDEVLDAIIMDYVIEVVDVLNEIAHDPSLNALEKYQKMFATMQEKRKQNQQRFSFLVKMFLKEENLLFNHRYTEKILELTRTPFVLILNQGVKEGLFKINDPEETAELIMRIGNVYRTKIALLMLNVHEKPNNLIKIRNIIEFMQDMVERILGLSPGTLKIISESFKSGIQS
jgi:AcrR family transcriptional regulator